MAKKENIGMETREMIKVKDVSAVSDQATNVSSKLKFIWSRFVPTLTPKISSEFLLTLLLT